jgi:hypothetical protein
MHCHQASTLRGTSLATAIGLISFPDEYQTRSETKRKRELEEEILKLLRDERTDDNLLNLDSSPFHLSAYIRVHHGLKWKHAEGAT